MKNLKKLARKELSTISGGDTPYAFCNVDNTCPPPFPSGSSNGYSSYCSDGICYRVYTGSGGGNPGCTEPQRFCQSWESGCGCVYI